MLTAEGRVKILDFGLAKFTGPDPADTEATRTLGSTEPGMIIGTVSI
jgi:hypothetical protein